MKFIDPKKTNMFPRHILCLFTTLVCLLAFSGYSHSQDTIGPLELSDLSLEELMQVKITTATKQPEIARTAPATVYVVTEKEIIENGYTDLEQVMRNVPGFEPIKFGYFLVGSQRGYFSNFSRTLIMMNGREVQFYFSGDMFISHQFATHNIKQIEFMHGPGSALYGANALLGVINIITKNDQKDYNQFEVQADLGTQNTNAVSIIFGHSAKKLRISGSLRHYHSDNYDFGDFVSDSLQFWEGRDRISVGIVDDQHVYRNKSRSIPFAYKVSYDLTSKLNLYVGNESYYVENGKGHPTINLRYDRNLDIRTSYMNYAGFEYRINSIHQITAEYQHYVQKQWGHNARYDDRADWQAYLKENGIIQINGDDTTYLPPNNPLTDEEVSKYFTGTYSNENSSGSRRNNSYIQLNSNFPGISMSMVTGYRLDHFDISPIADASEIGYEDIFPNVDETKNEKYYKHALYIQIQKGLLKKKLNFTLGGRLESHSRYKEIYNLRSGLVYTPFNYTVIKAMFGQAFADPYIYELVSNPKLKPSTINSWELAFLQQINRYLGADLTLYYNDAKDFIKRSKDNSIIFNDPNNVQTVGIESQAYFHWGKFSGKVNYSFVQPLWRDSLGGQTYQALNQYQHITNVSLNYRVIRHMNFNVNVNFYDAIQARHGNSTLLKTIDMPAFSMLNIALSSDGFSYGDSKLKFQIRVNNLLNKKNAYVPNSTVSGPKQFLLPGLQIFGRVMMEI